MNADAKQQGLKKRFHVLLTAIITSLLLLMAMPGHFAWWPFLFVALVPFLFFVVGNGPRLSLMAGLATGFLYHTGMLYWIVIVLSRYGGLPPVLSFAAMLLLSLYMALYPALFAWIVSLFLARERERGHIPASLILSAPALWVGLDWLRGILFSGFPWMDLGYGLFSSPVLLQSADIGGHHMLTFGVLMVNVLILFCIDRFRKDKLHLRGKPERLTVALAVFLLLLGSAYSKLRYRQISHLSATSPLLSVAVVQGNVEQLAKWVPDQKQLTLEKYTGLSDKAVSKSNPSLVIWPETALPFFPVNDPLFSSVRNWVDSKDAWLLTGAPYFELSGDLRQSFKSVIKYFNSALLIDKDGNVAGRYDKEHLVPFGEYVPFEKVLSFLEPLVESIGNFSPGNSDLPLSMENAELGVLICYESIFPDLARKKVIAGSDVLINITNDAWYGRSSAPFQSFAMAVLRAVENRRSLVRAANTGISGFVDPTGRVVEDSPIFETLFLASDIPVLSEKTVYNRFGYLFAPSCLCLFILMFVVRHRKNKERV